MLGLVIWQCQNSGRAIVWCSDHRELAYFDGKPRLGRVVEPLDIGDLVEVEIRSHGATRRCVSLRLLQAAFLPNVVDDLKARAPSAFAA